MAFFYKLVSSVDRLVFGVEVAFLGFLQNLLHDSGEVVGHTDGHIGDECLGFAPDRSTHVALG